LTPSLLQAIEWLLQALQQHAHIIDEPRQHNQGLLGKALPLIMGRIIAIAMVAKQAFHLIKGEQANRLNNSLKLPRRPHRLLASLMSMLGPEDIKGYAS